MPASSPTHLTSSHKHPPLHVLHTSPPHTNLLLYISSTPHLLTQTFPSPFPSSPSPPFSPAQNISSDRRRPSTLSDHTTNKRRRYPTTQRTNDDAVRPRSKQRASSSSRTLQAIDEAEDEWGQHDMKKVIPTSGNLRNVIPENFSYFHVEFGLDRGFVHVIDDDRNFPSSFDLNVVRGMLRLPEPNMHRHQRRESTDKQKQAVTAFVQEWEPFDWTRGLD